MRIKSYLRGGTDQLDNRMSRVSSSLVITLNKSIQKKNSDGLAILRIRKQWAGIGKL